MPWIMPVIGIGMGVAGGIIGGNAAEEQAAAQHAQAMSQYHNSVLQGQTQADHANRQRAQQNAANEFRNMTIARNANQIRTMKEMDLTEQVDIAFSNAANAYQVTRSNAESHAL